MDFIFIRGIEMLSLKFQTSINFLNISTFCWMKFSTISSMNLLLLTHPLGKTPIVLKAEFSCLE